MDGELGGMFVHNSVTPWNQYGAYIGVSSPYAASLFDPAAIKVNYTRFHVHKPSDDNSWSYFPFTALKEYEASEVAAGRPPIFVTATYQGKKRPVLWAWSLGLSGQTPTRPQQNWQYAVNVGDERFIRFWLNQYLRPKIWQGMYDVPNLWWGLDESAFLSSLYGVLDDNNQFVAGVPWDAPFPQSAAAYNTSVATFFSRVKALAPDVKLMANLGSLNDPNQIPTIYADVPGMVQEGYYEVNPSTYSRNAWIPYFNGISWFGAQGRVMVMRALISQFGDVQNAYALYQLLKGPNFFFAPMQAATGDAVPPAQYARMEADLGSPLAPFQSTQEAGMSVGYRLFWRMFDGGIVYMNWTGKTKTIVLPTDRAYFDTFGNRIQQITMADSTGAYVSTTATAKAAKPEISPRLALPTNGPLNISLKSDTPGTAIYYTLDGSTPTTASLRYVGPFSLSNNATVKAIATAAFLSDSTVGSAAYTINGTLPRVQFIAASDNGPSGPIFPVLSLDKIPNPNAPVRVNYSVTQPNGSTTSGSVTFLPGESYRYFPVTASGASNTITRVAITGLTNAIYGTTTQYTYTVGLSTSPNPGPPPTATPAAMVSPTPGSTLSGTSATFSWGGGVGVREYHLDIGTGGVGSKNILSLGVGTRTSQTVSGLPVGATLNVRLWSNTGTWMYRDYTYLTSGSTIARVVDPVPGSTLPSSVTFRWTAATGASEYHIYIGTVPGGFNVFSASTGLNLTRTVTNLPRNKPLYVRLWTRNGATWSYSDQSYTGGS